MAQISLKFVSTKYDKKPVVIDAADDAVFFVAEWMLADILGASTDKPTTPGKRTLACFAGRIPCAMHKADWLEVSRRTSYPKAIDTNEAAWGEYCKYSMLGYVRALTPQSVC